MAGATGVDKWRKYFSKGAVETEVDSKKKSHAAVWDRSNKTIDKLFTGHEITVQPTDKYDPKYPIRYVKNGQQKMGRMSGDNVSKPILDQEKRPLKIDIANLLAAANVPTKQVNIAGNQVRSFVLESYKEIVEATLKGLSKNRNVNEKIVGVFEEYFKQDDPSTIPWTNDISEKHMKELGSFVGELLIGYVAFKTRGRNSIFPPTVITDDVLHFIMPDDPSFPGIDSVIELKDGSVLPISSKFGVGAAASFFSNILPKGVKYKTKITGKSVFKDIINTAVSLRYTEAKLEAKQGGKEILYTYGINTLLGMKATKPMKVFDSAKAAAGNPSKLSPEASEAMERALSFKTINPGVRKAMPKSLTSFLSRQTADRLRKDSVAMTQMNKILAGKNFWQANLKEAAWKKGKIEFHMVTSGKAQLKIIGNKGGISDISGGGGMLNYELKKV
tara:strand:+ start:2675 stop:4009 length:1335 start_codon:yes stop_codon:yes gene_type:complete